MRTCFNLQALLRVLVYACALPVCALQVRADPVDELLMPGAVIAGHAKYESACGICHKQFDKPAQTGLCRDCHKEIAKDIDEKCGYHGLMREEKACRECHTDHIGRDAHIAKLETDGFDHETTGYTLKGGHLNAKVLCKDCHPPQKKYRDVPVKCNSCHEKADKHKGSLGTECQNCHEEKNWKTTHYDHSKTKFELLGKHKEVKCKACHLKHKYKDTPLLCNDCHKKDDKHEGQEGKKCETCHSEQSWKKSDFNHLVSRFPLTGKHLLVECKKCHLTPKFKDAKSDCWSCHQKQDKGTHKRTLGTNCQTCHNTRNWQSWDFNHDKTRFKLQGKHKDLKCVECHKTPVFKKMTLPGSCASCHDKDDKHDGSFGRRCEQCHVGSSWRTIIGDGWKELRIGGQRWINK